jgi:hypothetical protein
VEFESLERERVCVAVESESGGERDGYCIFICTLIGGVAGTLRCLHR